MIRRFLLSKGGTAAAGDVLAHARQHGASPATVHRAAARAGIVKTRRGSRTFLWSLPSDNAHDQDARTAGPDHDITAVRTARRHHAAAVHPEEDVDTETAHDRRQLLERAAAVGLDLSDWPPDQQHADVGLTDAELQAVVEDAEYDRDHSTPTPSTPPAANRSRSTHY